MNTLQPVARPSDLFPELPGDKMFLLITFVVALLVGLICDVNSNMGIFYHAAWGITVVMLLIVIFSPAQVGMGAFLLIAIASRDLTQSSALILVEGQIASATPWQLRLGPVTPGILMYGILFINLAKVAATGAFHIPGQIASATILFFLTVPLLAGVFYAGGPGKVDLQQFTSDLKTPLMMLTAMVGFYSLLVSQPHLIRTFCMLIIAAVLARAAIDFSYFILGAGPSISGVSRGSTDSGKSAVGFLFLLSIWMIARNRLIPLAIILGLVSGILIVVFATRMLWITAFGGTLIMLFAMGKYRMLLMLPIALLMAYAILTGLAMFMPDTAWTMSMRFKSIPEIFSGDLRDEMRVAQMINVWDNATTRFSFLWGMGYAGYYSDTVVPFHGDLTSAFRPEDVEARQFHRAHFFLTHYFLKYGALGLLILAMLWLRPWWRAFRSIITDPNRSIAYGCYSALTCGVIFLIMNMYWSSKGMLIGGCTLGIYMAVNAYCAPPDRSSQPIS